MHWLQRKSLGVYITNLNYHIMDVTIKQLETLWKEVREKSLANPQDKDILALRVELAELIIKYKR